MVNHAVTLGDNVVVGSDSTVMKSFPVNVVFAGNPVKVIITTNISVSVFGNFKHTWARPLQ